MPNRRVSSVFHGIAAVAAAFLCQSARDGPEMRLSREEEDDTTTADKVWFEAGAEKQTRAKYTNFNKSIKQVAMSILERWKFGAEGVRNVDVPGINVVT